MRSQLLATILTLGWLLSLVAPLPAPIFGFFPGGEKLVEYSSSVVVAQLIPDPPDTEYDPVRRTGDGLHQPHNVRILASLKGPIPLDTVLELRIRGLPLPETCPGLSQQRPWKPADDAVALLFVKDLYTANYEGSVIWIDAALDWKAVDDEARLNGTQAGLRHLFDQMIEAEGDPVGDAAQLREAYLGVPLDTDATHRRFRISIPESGSPALFMTGCEKIHDGKVTLRPVVGSITFRGVRERDYHLERTTLVFYTRGGEERRDLQRFELSHPRVAADDNRSFIDLRPSLPKEITFDAADIAAGLWLEARIEGEYTSGNPAEFVLVSGDILPAGN